MWKKLEKYLKNKKVLEIGCGIGQKTGEIIKYTDKITAVDISKESIDIAKRSFKNVKFLAMDASNLSFNDKSFDVVITTDSFHEMNQDIQLDALKEMVRCSNTIIFIEPDEVSVTNELFKVFDPNEDHSKRIKTSMDKVFKYMEDKNYELIETGSYKDIFKFNSKKEMCDEMLNWWNDIKIPSNDDEYNKMTSEIAKILNDFNMLDKLEMYEVIHFYVFKKGEE